MLIEDKKIETYKSLPKGYRGEIREIFRTHFGNASDTQFESIISKKAMPTPLQYKFITEAIEKYDMFRNGVVKEANI